ncbi:uncharacterized protein UMAG_12120 [Mycosarcoma maydis]|uniref:Uncharacterized protein n=1 Tax=Mycosarcoma maydis TaxID=5270 RepID=A0A0D1E9H5_MYCMD|nr:uncharacterized protein UMAG_12120 [Ustilago maydis 521]KIS71030.1 hypothetical protein UMAG_12120 [Ustilago maydis 521]|eukprot:XP_011387487.1 hypothetical protein UMAG_12120 [Ustilago maydis 521]
MHGIYKLARVGGERPSASHNTLYYYKGLDLNASVGYSPSILTSSNQTLAHQLYSECHIIITITLNNDMALTECMNHDAELRPVDVTFQPE